MFKISKETVLHTVTLVVAQLAVLILAVVWITTLERTLSVSREDNKVLASLLKEEIGKDLLKQTESVSFYMVNDDKSIVVRLDDIETRRFTDVEVALERKEFVITNDPYDQSGKSPEKECRVSASGHFDGGNLHTEISCHDTVGLPMTQMEKTMLTGEDDDPDYPEKIANVTMELLGRLTE